MSRAEAQKRYHEQQKNDPEYVARRREYGRKWRQSHKKEALDARKQYYKDNPEYGWLDSTKSRARRLKVPFNLTVEYIKAIYTDTCPVLGISLTRTIGGPSTDNSPTLDRIIPHLGYVEGNVMVISKLANQIKSSATPEQVQRVADFYRSLFDSRPELLAHIHEDFS